jgi:hypothetical protein
MNQLVAALEAWWAVDPVLTALGVALAAVFSLTMLLVLWMLCTPAGRIFYRALRRILWTKVGTTRNGPPVPRVYLEHLERKRIPRLLMSAEGAAFGRSGVIYLTPEEIGFVSTRFGLIRETNLPFAQISEAKISRGRLYDNVTVTTRERSERLRLYRSDRDVGQEFFNHLQMRLGAMRYRKA